MKAEHKLIRLFAELVLHDAILLATCLATLEKEIHCKLQETCYMLQSQAATYIGLKISAITAWRSEGNNFQEIVVAKVFLC